MDPMSQNISIKQLEYLLPAANTSSWWNMETSNATDETDPTVLPYYGAELHQFQQWYTATLHGYLSMTVCVFGIVANVLNIIVLTRRNMISPTNGILTGLAVADMLVIATYLPYTLYSHILPHPNGSGQSFSAAVLILIHAHVSVVFHTISTWLTVTLAVWRFMAVSFPVASKKWCSMQRAHWAIGSVYISCGLCCLPVYLSFTVHEDTDEAPVPSYKVDFSNITKANDGLLQTINFWTYSVLMKLVPCIALTGLSLGLIRVLYEANARRKRLKSREENNRTHDRTTRMLLAVLLLFLVTEFPSGIAALLSGILREDFFQNVYMNFGEVMDILALFNSAVNFVLYCSMSRQFRKTFAALFTPRIVSKWFVIPTDQNNTHETTCV